MERVRLHREAGPIDGLRIETPVGHCEVFAVNPSLGFARSAPVHVDGRHEPTVRLHFDKAVLGNINGSVTCGGQATTATILVERKFDTSFWPASGWDRRRGLEFQEIARLRTDDAGLFCIPNVLPGKYRLSAIGGAGAGSTIVVLTPMQGSVQAQMQLSGGQLTGQVFPRPTPGESLFVLVRAGGLDWDAPVNDNGTFRLSGLPHGIVTVAVEDRNMPPRPLDLLTGKPDRGRSVQIRAAQTTSINLLRNSRSDRLTQVIVEWAGERPQDLTFEMLWSHQGKRFATQEAWGHRVKSISLPEGHVLLVARLGQAGNVLAWTNVRCVVGRNVRVELKDNRTHVRLDFERYLPAQVTAVRFKPIDHTGRTFATPAAPSIVVAPRSGHTTARIARGTYTVEVRLRGQEQWQLVYENLAVSTDRSTVRL